MKPPRSQTPLTTKSGHFEPWIRTSHFSNGRQGGRWAVQRDEHIRWYTLSNYELTDAPGHKIYAGTLGEWTEEIDRIGIVHATSTRLGVANGYSARAHGMLNLKADHLCQIHCYRENMYSGTATGTEIALSPQMAFMPTSAYQLIASMALNSVRKMLLCLKNVRSKE